MNPQLSPTLVPRRPTRIVELLAQGLYLALAPRMPRVEPRDPPPRLGPHEALVIERPSADGPLAGMLYRTSVPSSSRRGLVVLAHPWHAHGQGYFFRRGRIPALRDAGYDVLSFDFGGFGRSASRPRGFFDRDLVDVLDAAERLAAGSPVHFWGVSAGGYWAHLVLARDDRIAGAVFEDVTRHLIGWSKRLAPAGLPFYLIFQFLLSPAYRYLDLYRHAPRLRVAAAGYVGGGEDRGALAAETRELARLASAPCRIVAEADHLEAIRIDSNAVIEMALSTFERAETAIAGERAVSAGWTAGCRR